MGIFLYVYKIQSVKNDMNNSHDDEFSLHKKGNYKNRNQKFTNFVLFLQ